MVALWFAGRGLGNEGAVTLHADTPRYLMNGVFFADLLRDHPFQAPVKYAQQYFARYPALSLGHHPFLTPLLEAPFFAILGVSVWAGRISVLFTIAVTVAFWFWFVGRIYDAATAFFASVLLGSTPMSARLAQEAGSEPLTICLIVLALFFLQRFCASERRLDGCGFIAAAVLSLYAKQLALFVFPVYALLFVLTFGFRRLLDRRTILAAAFIGVCILPIVPLTLKYSQFNVQIVTDWAPNEGRSVGSSLWQAFKSVTVFQAPLLVVVAAGLGTVVSAVRRDARALVFVAWMASVYLGLIALGFSTGRVGYYAAPPLCALAASLIAAGRGPRVRQALTAVVLIAAVQQIIVSAPVEPRGATGYEAAARFVAEHPLGDSVLYSSVHDSGWFVFFTRKFDPRREQIVMRADKILTTSRMADSDFELVVHRPEEILPILNEFGVGYVVLEDVPYGKGPLEWLRQLLHSDDFALRQRIPVLTSDSRLGDFALAIYEYKKRTPANRAARLSMKIPLVNDSVGMTFGDLLRKDATR
jgi:hypothetical protein